jgi:hypothetical protein
MHQFLPDFFHNPEEFLRSIVERLRENGKKYTYISKSWSEIVEILLKCDGIEEGNHMTKEATCQSGNRFRTFAAAKNLSDTAQLCRCLINN